MLYFPVLTFNTNGLMWFFFNNFLKWRGKKIKNPSALCETAHETLNCIGLLDQTQQEDKVLGFLVDYYRERP